MNADSYPMTNIVAPGDHDALCGRGGHTIHWSGNIKFRALVEQHRDRYHSASRVEKGKVVAEVVQMWRKMTPPGRFLALSDPKLGDASPWHDIGDKSAQKKTAKRLREGHSDARANTTSISSSSTVVSSDEDSTVGPSTSSNKRSSIRRVSSDSLEKAAKRARVELATASDSQQVPMMSLLAPFDDSMSGEVSDDNLTTVTPEPWAPIKASNNSNDLFVETDDLDLDCLFDDIQPEPLATTTTNTATTNKLDSSFINWNSSSSSSSCGASALPAISSSSFGGSALLQEIAVSIPSAACLTESILFD